jgi:hypothetical protein
VPADFEFDVQRQSPFTPEGQIESVGHFARGLETRHRRLIARLFATGAIVFGVIAVVVMVRAL